MSTSTSNSIPISVPVANPMPLPIPNNSGSNSNNNSKVRSNASSLVPTGPLAGAAPPAPPSWSALEQEIIANQASIPLDIDLDKHTMTVAEVVNEIFSQKPRNLRLATPLLWLAWFGSSIALTTFGVFLPKFLESKDIYLGSIYRFIFFFFFSIFKLSIYACIYMFMYVCIRVCDKSDALLFAVAAMPGPFIGAYLVETEKLGRRYTMAAAAFAISLCMLLFLFAESESIIVLLACLIGLLGQVYFAGLMCYTPEAYPTDIRTTASGIATGIRHMANILGPVLGGKLFEKKNCHKKLSIICFRSLAFVAVYDDEKLYKFVK
ncbi:sugar transporter [Reticulomyxa filosa]|uniref:Sugar transporter n=1 Tax=Reticulomyxa filosa TaxID=46433 RepID=X6NE38_RETFI|nr:sugar transporter [Reticulomyxa filosa]|eukprot:ETO23612.1 sugar transporter [Reticulomyxa filosa]